MRGLAGGRSTSQPSATPAAFQDRSSPAGAPTAYVDQPGHVLVDPHPGRPGAGLERRGQLVVHAGDHLWHDQNAITDGEEIALAGPAAPGPHRGGPSGRPRPAQLA